MGRSFRCALRRIPRREHPGTSRGQEVRPNTMMHRIMTCSQTEFSNEWTARVGTSPITLCRYGPDSAQGTEVFRTDTCRPRVALISSRSHLKKRPELR